MSKNIDTSHYSFFCMHVTALRHIPFMHKNYIYEYLSYKKEKKCSVMAQRIK